MFDSIGEKTFYIFGACNIIAIPMVYCLYPETNQRTLEDMDLLFAADTPWVWDAERTFAQLKVEQAHRESQEEIEEGVKTNDSESEKGKENATQMIEGE